MANLDPSPSASTSPQAPPASNSQDTHSGKAATKSSKIPSTLLDDIRFERKNKPQPRLPPNHRIQKRPITHPPIAAPYAGPDVQKVVYVSRNTPIMAAVKRVKKLLEQAEKRSLQRNGVLGSSKRAGNRGSTGQQKKPAKKEEVLVKGSGRAIEQAVKVGEWFKRHAEDGDGGWVVHVRPKSVKVIDDIVEDVPSKVDGGSRKGKTVGNDGIEQEGLEVTQAMEDDTQRHDKAGEKQNEAESINLTDHAQASTGVATARRRRDRNPKKRKRPMYEEDDVPEARTRFIDAIEIAVSLKE